LSKGPSSTSSGSVEVRASKAETRKTQRQKKRDAEVDQLNNDFKKPSKQSIRDKKDRKTASKKLATAQAFYSLKARTQVRVIVFYNNLVLILTILLL
jgi:hypothetical protein